MLLSNNILIPDSEIDIKAVRSQGAGGQNVNKVATAIHLRFDIKNSSLPDLYKERLLLLRDRRITSDGVLIIKAQKYRTQEKNRVDAEVRLTEFINKALIVPKKRTPTKPSYGSKTKRLEDKTKRSQVKSLRGKVGI